MEKIEKEPEKKFDIIYFFHFHAIQRLKLSQI